MKKEMYKCEMCDKIFSDEDILMGKNPFIPAFTIYGCPHCKEIEHFVPICDFDDCNETISGGTPTEEHGYIHACSRHLAELRDDEAEDAELSGNKDFIDSMSRIVEAVRTTDFDINKVIKTFSRRGFPVLAGGSYSSCPDELIVLLSSLEECPDCAYLSVTPVLAGGVRCDNPKCDYWFCY